MPQIIQPNPQIVQQLCDMARSPNALATNIRSPEKHKHSVLFHISPKLFDNRRLKQKRAKWAATRERQQLSPAQHVQPHVHTKTDWRRAALVPAETIDLLSDDDDEPEQHLTLASESKQLPDGNTPSMPGPPPLAPIQGVQLHAQPMLNGQAAPLQHFFVYPGNMPSLQLSNVPNIRLIPISLGTLQQPTLGIQNLKADDKQQPQQKPSPQPPQPSPQSRTLPQAKRKRKSHQPQRHSQPTIVNNESIVLTDDSDDAEAPPPVPLPATTHAHSPIAGTALDVAKNVVSPIVPAPAAAAQNSRKSKLKMPETATLPPPQPPPAVSPVRIAQVDEEVTVSLVPRSTTGSCTSKTTNTKLFPMQPDETTVHTVIANRIYELSLTKLREGLGIDCIVNKQTKPSPTRRKGGKANGPQNAPPPTETPPQQHISLKLSSDLSISLISDDDDDDDVDFVHRNQPFNPDKLQLPAHLAVQQVHLPAADTGQLPRRRKLG